MQVEVALADAAHPALLGSAFTGILDGRRVVASVDARGMCAEWIVVREESLLTVPVSLAAEVAALVEPLARCLLRVERAEIAAGDIVAIRASEATALLLAACVADAGGWPVLEAELAADFGAHPGAGESDVELDAPDSSSPPAAAVRAALGFLASGAYPWERLITHRMFLDDLPSFLADPPAGLLGSGGDVRTLTLRELNRTLLSRQFLLERKRISVAKAVERLVGAAGAVRAVAVRRALVADRRLPQGAVDERADRRRGRQGRLDAHDAARDERERLPRRSPRRTSSRSAAGPQGSASTSRRCAPRFPTSRSRATSRSSSAYRVLGTDDRWTVAFALSALPRRSHRAVGPWPHTKPSPWVLWREPLPDAGRRGGPRRPPIPAAYGPASREDIAQFTYFKFRQIDPALEGLRTFADERGPDALRPAAGAARTRRDVPRLCASCRRSTRSSSPIATGAASSRPSTSATVFNTKNATTKQTFTVDGFVAGAWRIERKRGRWQIELEPFAPLPAKWRREVTDEGERLVAFYES